MNIITGYRAEPHVTSQQERDTNAAVFGTGTYIVNLGSKLAASIISANEIQIADGMVIAEGCSAVVDKGTSESLTIESGSQGMLRIDLIVARYSKNAGTGVEDMQLTVITGTPASSSPATPSYNTGSIANGDVLVDFPLYRVDIDGITIQNVTRLVDYVTISTKAYVDSVKTTLQNAINTVNTNLTNLINTTKTQLQNSINAVSNTLTTVSNRVGTATLNTSAKNALAAINELLTKINTANSNITAANSRIDTTNSNVTAVANRATALESKTVGLVGIKHFNIDPGATQYLQLHTVSMYMFIVNGAGNDNGMRGIYIVGTTGTNAIGIKAASAAGSVSVTDAGNGLIKFVNNGAVVMRLTSICTYGTQI